MKTPSKLDQARAMREARYSVEPVRIAVSTEAIDQALADPYRPSPAVAALKDAKALNALPVEVRAKVSADFVRRRALIAPAGECPYCDDRRAANALAQKKWRQSE